MRELRSAGSQKKKGCRVGDGAALQSLLTPFGGSGTGGADSANLRLRSFRPASFINVLKRLGGNENRFGCPLLKLAPDGIVKTPSYIRLFALLMLGNVLQARLKAELNSSTFCAIPVIAHPLCGWPRLRVGSLRKAAVYATLASIHNHVVQTRYRPEGTGRPIATNQRNPSINVPHLS